MITLIEFTEDFATKKKGEFWEVEGQFANRLIKEGVAKKRERKPKKTNKKDK